MRKQRKKEKRNNRKKKKRKKAKIKRKKMEMQLLKILLILTLESVKLLSVGNILNLKNCIAKKSMFVDKLEKLHLGYNSLCLLVK